MRQWEYLRLSVCTWERRAKGWLDECLVILKNSFLSSGRGGKSNDRGGNRILLKERVTQSEGQVFTARKHQRVCTPSRLGQMDDSETGTSRDPRKLIVRLQQTPCPPPSLCRQLLPGLSVNKRTWTSYSSMCLCVVLYFVFVLIFLLRLLNQGLTRLTHRTRRLSDVEGKDECSKE